MQEIINEYWMYLAIFALLLSTYIILQVGSFWHDDGGFKYKVMPTMQPLPIKTKGKGVITALWVWFIVTRKWKLTKDFHYSLDGMPYVIPKGFVFDGASVPKMFRNWLSPMGVLLIGGLVHDYGYKYATLLRKGKNTSAGLKSQKELDIIFRDINISVNGFKVINYIAYYALRLGGFLAWRGHRKRGLNWKINE